MSAVAVQEIVPPVIVPRSNGRPVPDPRRFQMPDLDHHAVWFLPRFLKSFPHLTQANAIGFLRSVVYNNEFLFLYQDNAIGLAQATSEHTLQPSPMIWERFVFCENPENVFHQQQAAMFYEEFARWAKRKGIEQVIVEQVTDVPIEMIEEKIGTLTPVEMQLARV